MKQTNTLFCLLFVQPAKQRLVRIGDWAVRRDENKNHPGRRWVFKGFVEFPFDVIASCPLIHGPKRSMAT